MNQHESSLVSRGYNKLSPTNVKCEKKSKKSKTKISKRNIITTYAAENIKFNDRTEIILQQSS